MVLVDAGACVPSSLFRLSFRCTCGVLDCGASNDEPIVEEQESLKACPQQMEMTGSGSSSTGHKARSSPRLPSAAAHFQASAKGEVFEDDGRSTESGSSGSSASSGSSSGSKDRPRDATPPKRPAHAKAASFEESWYTPNMEPAERREFDHKGANPVEAAVAAALTPELPERAPGGTLRQRHCDEVVAHMPQRESQQDWWDDTETKVVPGLEAAASLTRLVGGDLIKHPNLKKKQGPWSSGQSHPCYRSLGGREAALTYVAWWLNVGDCSLLSLHEVIDRPALERCLANDPLGKRVKLLIRAVKCTLPFPGKGPKEADTVGAFFGKGASLTRTRTAEDVDMVVIQIDLFYLFLLRCALQNVGFRQGNIVDIILVDWPGQAILASIRLSVTEEFMKLKA